MKTRRAICLAAFLTFSLLSLKTLLDLAPSWQPDSYFKSPEGIIFILPLLFIYAAVSLSALYGAWRSHRALQGDVHPTRGVRALMEGLVWIVFGFGLLGLMVAGLIFAFGHLADHTFWQVTWRYMLMTPVGVAGLASFYGACRAFLRVFSRSTR